jgi:hypothetical protein
VKKQIGNVVSEMTDEEYAAWKAAQDEIVANRLAEENAAKIAADKRQAVLDKLGLTADEAAALFG